MLTPFEPRAGPTGGAGVAFPASRASFMIPTTVCHKHKHVVINYIATRKSKWMDEWISLVPFFALPPPGLGGAMAVILKRLWVVGSERGVLFWRETPLGFKDNLRGVENIVEEEEEHSDGVQKSVDAIQLSCSDKVSALS